MKPVEFDLCGPLPTSTTLLEASAGTGKTYAIAALATRYIASGEVTIDQILMITFGRSATRELRERVRESLTLARDSLRADSGTSDPVIAQLLALPDGERRQAADRLSRAVADFDSGTIATTHQFCMNALAGLGISANLDPGEVFVENISDLVEQVVRDFYIRKYGAAATDRLPYAEALTLARKAVGDPQASLDAGPVAPGSQEQTRVHLAQAVRAEVQRRRRAQRLVTFDDLVMRLQQALAHPQTGPLACQRLRDTYRVVLVDEFQDTDPAQWDILERAFHGHRTLILIGDPKQAIYAFRGADVFSYLQAADVADHHATLPINWRSDAAVVEGVQALMGGLHLGSSQIVVHPVRAHHDAPRLVGLPGTARVRLRTLHPKDAPSAGEARAAVVDDVAADIVDLLSGQARLEDGDTTRPVLPGDIAVLVTKHSQAAAVHKALDAAGVPAVLASANSVFASPAAQEWALLLQAMQAPRSSALRQAALTDFLGYTPSDFAERPDEVDAAVALQLKLWATTLDEGSVAEMVAAMEQDRHLMSRVLSRPAGERHITDVRHVAGVLHAQQRSSGAGLTGLLDWLQDQIRRAEVNDRDTSNELTRRLDSDAAAVQLLTIHVSKGLEFPIAYVPFGWDRFVGKSPELLVCHTDSGQRVLDVRGPQAIDRDVLLEAHKREEAGESLRLLYVALTRASSHLVVHWSSSKANTESSALHRALSARNAGSAEPLAKYPVGAPPDPQSPWVEVQPVQPRRPPRWQKPDVALPDLRVAPFTRHVDTAWRRTSYSGLTREVHAEHAPLGFRDDEPAEQDTTAGPTPAGLASPFADLPAGAAFGTLVHGVLEAVNTQAPDLPAEVMLRCREQLVVHPLAEVSPETLSEALLPVLRTPLGPVAQNACLAEIAVGDRLPELDFELPMNGRTLADLAALLRQYKPLADSSDGDLLAGYADLLDSPGLRHGSLLGYLSGSIDAVLRLPGPSFVVVDYKTNLLRDPATPGVENLVCGYEAPAMAAAMMAAHYPLQALLYSAALHRFLRWRLPGYDPSRHLGGILYLFVRGMAGPSTPSGSGVFSWKPDPALIVDLSDLLDGRWP